MKTRPDIIYRLVPFLVGVLPEMVATTLLAIILEPSILVGPALWLLEGLASDMVLSFLRLMFLLYVWAKLPRRLRQGLLGIAAAFLPNRILCHLGVIPREVSKAEVGMDSLDRTRVQKTRINNRGFHNRSSELSDAAIVIKMAENNGDHTLQQPKSTKRPPLWKRVWRWTKFGQKSGWDWLQLLVVPVLVGILAVGLTAWFNNQQGERQQRIETQRAQQQQEIEDQRAEAERNLAERRAQDEALQAYLNQMSQLMLDRDLLESQEGDPVYTLAQARTSTIIVRLDAEHNVSVINFLIDSGLYGSDQGSISLLRGMDLNNASLSRIYLGGADLSGAYLIGAYLIGADLSMANLSGANLRGAIGITNEALEQQAETLKGATMPNGQKYEEWLNDRESGGEDGE